MSTITYLQEDAGGYEVEDVRTRFIDPLAPAIDAALGPARALFDASLARAIATNLAAALEGAGRLFESVLATRRALQADNSTRPEVLRERWGAFGDDVNDQASQIDRTIATDIDKLVVALKQEALPTTTDPAAITVARQEIEVALRASQDDLPFQVLLEQAVRGGDVAAAAASAWGRLTLVASQGDDVGFDDIVNAAVETALTGPDEGRRRAAAALNATRMPRNGETVAALPEAQTFASFVLMVCRETVAHGIVL